MISTALTRRWSTEHGMRGFYVRADFATIARIDATVAYLARVLLAMGDTTTLDQRRVKAVLIMANPVQAVKILTAYQQWHHTNTEPEPGSPQPDSPEPDSPQPDSPEPEPEPEPVDTTPRRFDPTEATDLLDDTLLLPAVWLFAHLAGSDLARVARVEGSDPVTTDWVRTHLGERCRFKITPVLDPLDQVPVDAYEIPDRHRHAVHLLTPADTFPFAANTTRQMQIDHTIAWSQARATAGEKLSRIGNYGPMTVLHHRIKTHGGWSVRQPFPGLYLWQDPHGTFYLVDHTGTRRLPPRPRPRPGPRPPTGSVIEARLTALALAS